MGIENSSLNPLTKKIRKKKEKGTGKNEENEWERTSQSWKRVHDSANGFFFLLFQTGRFLLDSLNWMFDTTKEEQ